MLYFTMQTVNLGSVLTKKQSRIFFLPLWSIRPHKPYQNLRPRDSQETHLGKPGEGEKCLRNNPQIILLMLMLLEVRDGINLSLDFQRDSVLFAFSKQKVVHENRPHDPEMLAVKP